MKAQPPQQYRHMEAVRLVWLAIFVSVFSFLFYNRAGDVTLYGDAVAHINIARRVFDSKTPGLLQLGTVWLPLQHLLILPFIISKRLWQTGAGGSIPSMAAYVFGVLGIFRLVRGALSRGSEADDQSKTLAWLAALLYAGNPNLIYMQSTAMGESLYLALAIWAVAFFVEFREGNSKALFWSGWCLFAAGLTRYDGWFLAFALMGTAAVTAIWGQRAKAAREIPGSPIFTFILLALAAPALWLAYNAAVYRNPLEFANGPYSAKAIEIKTGTVNPAQGNVIAGASYFLKAAESNVASNNWLGRLWLALALIGSLSTLLESRARLALLLWSPLPFYALSLAYGKVPIFVAQWWPFSLYNVRYGLQLLPAFAVFVPLGIVFLVRGLSRIQRIQALMQEWSLAAVLICTLLFGTASYTFVWRSGPACFREASVNMRGRVVLEKQLADWLKWLPPNATLLMYLGEHSGALEQAGVDLSQSINEGNHRVWKQPTDPAGLWERALADPAAYADFAIGFEGDPVWKAARDRNLKALLEIHTTGQPPAVIFQARAR